MARPLLAFLESTALVGTDAHELPVRHQTRRMGSPYTLVLTKSETLFEREAATRCSRQADLAWLTGQE